MDEVEKKRCDLNRTGDSKLPPRFAVAAALIFVAVEVGAQKDGPSDPCSGADVAAFVASKPRKCSLRRIDKSDEETRELLKKNDALRAADEIECAADGEVTLTFCGSRQDFVVRGREIRRYSVPNAPGRGDLPNSKELRRSVRPVNERAGPRNTVVANKDVPIGGERVANVIRYTGIPTCEKKLGTLVVAEPENKWWTALNLESPEALIKVFVSQSHCFTIVDRGKGMASMQMERLLAGGGELHGGSNAGKGQMKAADYVLVPDLVNKDAHGSGKSVGEMPGGMFRRRAGAVSGGVNLKSKTLDVVLTLTDVRSTEQVSQQQGHAMKTDLGWASSGSVAFFGGFPVAGASGYANTAIGQAITMAYFDAFVKLVDEARNRERDSVVDNVRSLVTMAKPGKMYEAPDTKANAIRDLDAGTTLRPTGEKQGIFWKVADELGNEGWVPSTLFKIAMERP